MTLSCGPRRPQQGTRPRYGDTGTATAEHYECSALDGFLAITSQPLGPEVIYNHLHNNGLKLIKLVHFPEHWLKKWEMESVAANCWPQYFTEEWGQFAMNETIMKQTNVIDWMLICIKMMWESDLNESGGMGQFSHWSQCRSPGLGWGG